MGVGHNKWAINCCNCGSSNPTVPSCICSGISSNSFNIDWTYWTSDASNVVQLSYPNTNVLTYHSVRPNYTKTGFSPDNTTLGTYTEWGPAWYSDIINHDITGRPNGSSAAITYSSPQYYWVFALKCTTAGFVLTSADSNGTSGAWGPINTGGTAWLVNGTSKGANISGHDNYYATGVNTCSYLYDADWFGPYNGRDGYIKNGTELIITGS